ncbi:ubiquinol-cytochrome c reductase complex assembly factor 4 [Salminus brasiliensis]|uniref:ubiquinol-cytochrome c reductase complex assembly factor 4 n=1 Tax=Salminus brasiliensis TaxID=930266 RepID=UPI003B83631E
MASSVCRAFIRITSFSSPGRSGLQCFRPCTVRALTVTSHCFAKSQRSSSGEEVDEELPRPIKFTTSKASHRTWKVERSMGSTHQQPWWHVVPFSMVIGGFLLWCVFRKDSEVDQDLEKKLFERLPGLLTVMGEDEEDDDDEEEAAQTEAAKKEL